MLDWDAMSDTTTTMPGPRQTWRVSRETRLVRANLTVAAALLVGFAVYTWLVVDWSPFIRLDADLNRNFHVHSLWPELHFLDRVGQRVLILEEGYHAIRLPGVAAVVRSLAKRGRGLGLSVVTVVHHVSDVPADSDGIALLREAGIVHIFAQETQADRDAAALYGLPAPSSPAAGCPAGR